MGIIWTRHRKDLCAVQYDGREPSMRRDQHPQHPAHQANSSRGLPRAPRDAPRANPARPRPAPAHAANLPAAAQDSEAARDTLPVAPDSPAPLLLTPTEAARALHINRSTLYPLLMRGEIASICIGRARRIPREALLRWITQQVSAQQVNAQHAQGDGSA